jgi:hypothetical protein
MRTLDVTWTYLAQPALTDKEAEHTFKGTALDAQTPAQLDERQSAPCSLELIQNTR